MLHRPRCEMPRCDVQIMPGDKFCAGHIYLNSVERKRTEDFAKRSHQLLQRIKAIAKFEAHPMTRTRTGADPA